MGLSVPLFNPELHLAGGRISLTTGVPVTTSDVTGASAATLRLVPFKGNRTAVLVGSRVVLRKFVETTLAVQASLFRCMDVFEYDNAGTLALEQTAWDSGGQTTKTIIGATNATPVVITSTSHGLSNGTYVGISGLVGNTYPNGKIWKVANVTANTFELEGSTGNGAYVSGGTAYVIPTARTTAIVLDGAGMEGVYTKSGDPTRKWRASYMTLATSGQTEDSAANRMVFNAYNRVIRNLLKDTGAGLGSYNSGNWRFHQLDATNRVQFMVGLQEDLFDICWGGLALGGDGYLSTALNAIAGLSPAVRNANTTYINAAQSRKQLPNLGMNYLQAVEFGAASFQSSSPTITCGFRM